MIDQDFSANSPSSGNPRPSKTRRKKASHDLQRLGADLAALPEDRLACLPLDDALREALITAKKIRSHEGRRRHMQLIGKLMHHADAMTLQEAVASAQLGSARDALALHEMECWRSKLIASDDALTAWAAQHPGTDLQVLRTLIRAARKDAALPEQRNGRAFRELFQWLRQHGIPARP